jgi:hypothetical protein
MVGDPTVQESASPRWPDRFLPRLSIEGEASPQPA